MPAFRDVLAFHGGGLRRAGVAWGRLAADVRERVVDLAAALRDAELAWEGRAAEAAVSAVRHVLAQLQRAELPLRAHEQTLVGVAHAGDRLRERARGLVAGAPAAGVTVDRDGRVAPLGPRTDVTARAVDSYRRQVVEVVAEARRLDREAVAGLARHAPWPPGGSAATVATETVPPPGSHPVAVRRWWDGLSAAQQRYLAAHRPHLVAALDGVPVTVRDLANRTLLAAETQRLRGRIADLERRERELDVRPSAPVDAARRYPAERVAATGVARRLLAEQRRAVEATLAGLAAVQRRLDAPAPGGQRAYLLDLSVEGDGRVVLALGNPDLADNVVTYVPGAGTTLAGVEGHLRRTEALAAEADRWDGSDRSAAVYWLGYDAPDWGLTADNPLRGGPAAEAAVDLRRFAAGLRATHAGGGSATTFLGHSYGSTVVGQAAVGGLAADRLVFLGSPGVVAERAADLRIDADPSRHVWSATAGNDPIRYAPDCLHGPDPSAPEFGGRVFAAAPDGGHSGYWDAGNPAREGMALIAVGRYADVKR
ncbi:MAG TPA: alpha/beta hydrolase [Natronosporangium sp.]|nr:alpha/beta hydrolase [Natronosporangium sp.]